MIAIAERGALFLMALSGILLVDILIWIALITSGLFTIIGIGYPICRLIGIVYEDGILEFYKLGFEINLGKIFRKVFPLHKGKYEKK